MLSQTMAKAWAPEIAVNCIAPGMIVQPGRSRQIPPTKHSRRPHPHAAATEPPPTSPPPPSSSPPAAHFITGQLLAVDGGLGL